jgi:hypothetical protein
MATATPGRAAVDNARSPIPGAPPEEMTDTKTNQGKHCMARRVPLPTSGHARERDRERDQARQEQE